MSTHNIHFQNKIRDLELTQVSLYLHLWKKTTVEIVVVNEASAFEQMKFYCI